MKSYIFRNLINSLGWKTKRKLLIIESDDWGSLRMASNKSLNNLRKLSLNVEDDPFNKLDTLETSEDLFRLFEVLNKRKDKNDNPPCITTNTILTNPHFEKIEKSNFQTYYNIGLEDSYYKYSDGDYVISALWEGIKSKFITPQFHGREHLNVPLWMEALQKGDRATLLGFNEHVYGLKPDQKQGFKKNFMAAFETSNSNNLKHIENSILEGLKMFETYFKSKSKTIIAPAYIWDEQIERISSNAGVKGIQGIPFQYKPRGNQFKRVLHYTGQKNKYNQIYLVRNAFFEPSIMYNPNIITDCLMRIDVAFKWGKPAIIGSHRINFMGSLDENNRNNNLKLLDNLLTQILKKWPDVEFISSDQLINIIRNN